MNIERSLFLALTTALAGAACGSDPPPEPKVPPTEPAPTATAEPVTPPAAPIDAGPPSTLTATAAAAAAVAATPAPPPPPAPKPLGSSTPCKATTKRFDPN